MNILSTENSKAQGRREFGELAGKDRTAAEAERGEWCEDTREFGAHPKYSEKPPGSLKQESDSIWLWF